MAIINADKAEKDDTEETLDLEREDGILMVFVSS
jgi:hypothetical protein